MTSASGTALSERATLAAARGGDPEAFRRLVEPHRAALVAHCYRMLGSLQDAEDALQDTLLRAWRALPRFEGRSSVRSWLYTIATNASLRAIERRPRRVLPFEAGPAEEVAGRVREPLAEVAWIEPYPDQEVGDGLAGPEARYEQRESLELAFIAAMQHLPARQRAVLIMRDVLGFSGADVAETLETTPAAVYSALQRAHRTVDERLPDVSQQATLRSLGDAGLREVVDGYVDAWERGDLDALVAMLTEDARLEMPPTPTWYAGRDAVAAFLHSGDHAAAGRWRLVPARANAQVAFGKYLWRADAASFRAHQVNVLTLRGDRIARITAFLTPGAFARFGLPADLRG
ncbi:MAG TPA: sigma-70 family RNA polymerase sigma factor [Miltoncostaeaceae bacterium]|nr:sigma-70 family RNA polymerase sigma factor [Miltoncostaeaceae bacterium]